MAAAAESYTHKQGANDLEGLPRFDLIFMKHNSDKESNHESVYERNSNNEGNLTVIRVEGPLGQLLRQRKAKTEAGEVEEVAPKLSLKDRLVTGLRLSVRKAEVGGSMKLQKNNKSDRRRQRRQGVRAATE